MKFEQINYDDLNGKQQENYNYHKVAAVLADFGYTSILLSDDWNGADFLAVHKDGACVKIQLKGRMSFESKYLNKDLFVCFPNGEDWYIYPHDEMLVKLGIDKKNAWLTTGKYTFPSLSLENQLLLQPYLVPRLRAEAA